MLDFSCKSIHLPLSFFLPVTIANRSKRQKDDRRDQIDQKRNMKETYTPLQITPSTQFCSSNYTKKKKEERNNNK